MAQAGSASPSSIAFGNVPINTTVNQDVTITVDAGYQIQIASGSGINAPFAFDFNTCGTGGGFTGPGTCNVRQRYAPTALTSSNGTTNVFQCPTAGGSCIAIPYTVSGTGISAAGASPASVAYGNVALNTTATRDITLTVNAGYRYSGATGTGTAAPFGLDAGTCGAGGGFTGPGTCVVHESFSPTAVGPVTATLTLNQCLVAGGGCIPVDVPLTGAGTNGGPNPATVDFGDVDVGSSAWANVRIVVDAGYKITGASGSGTADPFSVDLKSCTDFVAGVHCTLRETFAPTSAGPATGTLIVTECLVAGGGCIDFPITLAGNGVLVATTLSLSSSKDPSKVGQAISLTAKVTPASGSSLTGTVTFKEGATTLDVVPVSGKRAILTTDALSAGTHTITATYSGDAAHSGSTATFTQTVQPAV